MMTTASEWIALDWGTTHLRAWRLSADGTIIHSAKSERGMASLSPSGFEGALIELISPWLTEGISVPVVGCGMVGAKQGWQEVPYTTTPCKPITTPAKIRTLDRRIEVHICGGIKQDSPADVMRGEETQVAGFVARNPGFDGILCLPGTHSKWVSVEGGSISGFQTFMTGELFALLAEQSVLRHSIDVKAWDEGEFVKTVVSAIESPHGAGSSFFNIRAEGLLNGLSPAAGHARLSGFLIGQEIAGAAHFWKTASKVGIIGDSKLASHYQAAFAAVGLSSDIHPVEAMTLAGLQSARFTLGNG